MNESDIFSYGVAFRWNPSTVIWASLIFILLFAYLEYHWKRRHLYKLSSKVPGPFAWPIIGSSHYFMGSATVIFNNVMNLFKKYPNLIRVWYGHQLVYGVSKPEYLEAVFTNPKAFSKMYLYRYAEPTVGHGLFTAPVPIWKRHRKIIMPTFNQKILDGFVEIFVKKSTIMGQKLEDYDGKGTFDVFVEISKCTLDTLCETAMGININAQTTNSDFAQWIDRLMEIMFLRMFVIWYHFDFIFKWTQLAKDERDLLKKFRSFTEKIIKERRETFERNKNVNFGKRKAFLDLLLELSFGENKLTDEELEDEVNTFMIAGTDTTATTSAFIFVMLGMNPEIQEKVYSEIMEILGDKEVEFQDLPNLKYTENVIKETLRLFPVGPYIVRDLEEDIPLEGDLALAKGSSALLGIIHVQRNGSIWPNPLKFDPDRFLPEEVAKRHPFSYIPFSGGPRNCVGMKYAMMFMKTLVATIIRKYKFSTSYKDVADIELKTNLVLRAPNGYPVSVQLRKNEKCLS